MTTRMICWIVGGVFICSPLLRNAEGGDRQEGGGAAPACGEWTEARRQADPDGYFQFAIQRLQQEADELEPACQALKEDIERQSVAIQEKLAMWKKAKDLAATFRQAYRRATVDNQWPVEVENVVYCEEQLCSQVSMFLEEAKGLAECVAKMKAIRERAEAKLEELTVRKTRVDAQISIAMALHQMWKASRLRSQGEEVLAHLEELIKAEPPQLGDWDQWTPDGFPQIPEFCSDNSRNSELVFRFLDSENPKRYAGKPALQNQNASGKKQQGKPIFVQCD